MEPGAAALGAVPQQVLDEPEADVTRRRTLVDRSLVDGIELHDGPLVAGVVGLHPGEPSQSSILLVDVQRVVRLERAERHPEQAEDAHLAGRHGQAEGADRAVALLARGVRPAGQLAERGEVGQACGTHAPGREASSTTRGCRVPRGRRYGARGWMAVGIRHVGGDPVVTWSTVTWS